MDSHEVKHWDAHVRNNQTGVCGFQRPSGRLIVQQIPSPKRCLYAGKWLLFILWYHTRVWDTFCGANLPADQPVMPSDILGQVSKSSRWVLKPSCQWFTVLTALKATRQTCLTH